jgi:predicted tellurium resistance membrane protein TerC
MLELLTAPQFWIALFSVSLVQIALGADNLIIITIIANKLPPDRRHQAVRLGLILAMAFRIVLLFLVSTILKYAIEPWFSFDRTFPLGLHVSGQVNGKALLLMIGGLVLIWKGIKELRHKSVGVEEEMQQAERFGQVVFVIVAMNLLFSVDSILTVVGMTDIFAVMVGSVLLSVALMLVWAKPISRFMSKNPDFEILGLFVLLLIGFVLFLEGGHVAHLAVNGSQFPYIPQWIVIFVLMLMFSVDLYQNWYERRQPHKPLVLHRRKR